MEYNFLSIGGNCACIHTLHDKRVCGPLDNMKSKYGLGSIQAIFNEGGLNKEFFEIGEIEQPFCGNHRDDKEIWFSTPNYYIIHNNFRDVAFRKSLKLRIKNFYEYLNSLEDNPKNYLVYSLCEKDIDPVNNKMSDSFIYGYNILKDRNLLDKVVFLMITSDDRKWYHYVCSDIYNYSKNVLEFHINIYEQESNYLKFLKLFLDLILYM